MIAGCAEPGRCDFTLAQEIAFTAPDAGDTVTTRVFGPSCDKAVALYDVRDAEGHPIWVWTASLPLAFGDVFPRDEPEAMHDFLERWGRPRIERAGAAPEWTALVAGQTTLDRSTYEDIRARDLPLLCHASGAGRELCVFWEPAAGAAGHFLDRTLEEP